MADKNASKKRQIYSFPMPPNSDVRRGIIKVQNRYGYAREVDAAFNLLKVGLKIFEKNPDEYLNHLTNS